MAATTQFETFPDRLRRFLRPPRRLRFTRKGRWFVAMTLALGFAAINTGNNLLYMILGMMLGLIVVSGIMSEAMLRRVTVERMPQGVAFASAESAVQYRLFNDKRLVPSFSIEVSEVERRETTEMRLGKRAVSRKQRKKEQKARDPAIPRCLAHRVDAGRTRVQSGRFKPPRRGMYHYDALEVTTRFPFGFFEKSRRIDRVGERLVYPRVVNPPPRSEGSARPEGTEERPKKGIGQEYLALRDYFPGEDWRRIHWKVSARRGTLIVRETQEELSKTCAIVINNAIHAGAPGSVEAGMERLIEVAAAMARELINNGLAVGLISRSGALEPGVGGAQLTNVLRALAVLPVQKGEPTPLAAIPSGRALMVLELASGSPVCPQLPNAVTLKVDERGQVRVVA